MVFSDVHRGTARAGCRLFSFWECTVKLAEKYRGRSSVQTCQYHVSEHTSMFNRLTKRRGEYCLIYRFSGCQSHLVVSSLPLSNQWNCSTSSRPHLPSLSSSTRDRISGKRRVLVDGYMVKAVTVSDDIANAGCMSSDKNRKETLKSEVK